MQSGKLLQLDACALRLVQLVRKLGMEFRAEFHGGFVVVEDELARSIKRQSLLNNRQILCD